MKTDNFNILVPTDFSDNAWSATSYALQVYADKECTFYFINSLSLSHADSRTYVTTRYVDVLTETSKRELNEWQSRALKLGNPKHRFEVLSTSEDITTAIVRAVKRYHIDMVVGGTKGATGVNKFFLGSNTVKIIQNLDTCAMLAVPDKHQLNVPKHIAFPTDFNRVYTTEEISTLISFANLYNAHIYVLHINLQSELTPVQQQNMTTLQGLLNHQEHTFHWKEKSGTKAESIHAFIQELHIDVLAMVHYKHSFIENIMKEPVIKTIGFQPTVPFLVIPQ